uniref:Uncharacterized protein n=1 Tax=Tetranychus urticae TaxID=32264 RepID=T1L275_TETUR
MLLTPTAGAFIIVVSEPCQQWVDANIMLIMQTCPRGWKGFKMVQRRRR